MNIPDDVAALPATERALVGLCHGFNDQLAALNAYVFLLERRGVLEGSDEPLKVHLDRMADQVRLARALARDPEPQPSPVAVSLLAEAATQIMHAFPEGPVIYETADGDEGVVVRCDWGRALRALVVAGSWISRETTDPVRALVRAEGRHGLTVEAVGELTGPRVEDQVPDTSCEDVTMEWNGPRSVRIILVD